jgi:radical SAM superfamily enzyme YgiQ (UPF0313 family)
MLRRAHIHINMDIQMLNYIEPVFRPPSEGKSLILQVTNGCSWNQCSFCDMYTQPQKQFRAQKLDRIELDIRQPHLVIHLVGSFLLTVMR